MIAQVSQRLRQAKRIAVVPLLVRIGIFAVTLLALILAWSGEPLLERTFAPLVGVAALTALAPRRIWPTFAALVAIAGWLLVTSRGGGQIPLWRLLALATLLYLMHSLCALAAVLPYDALVDLAMVARWVLQALAVTLVAAVLAILLLALAGRTGGAELPIAMVVGSGLAVLAAALLSWLLRRRQR